jgi:hypothetical protein
MKKTHGLSDSDDEEEEEEEEGSAETRGMGSGYKSTFGRLPGTFLLLLYCCFTAALLLLYRCFTAARAHSGGYRMCSW